LLTAQTMSFDVGDTDDAKAEKDVLLAVLFDAGAGGVELAVLVVVLVAVLVVVLVVLVVLLVV
jgi:hypothetical protein